jgi:hypothetical protein
MKTQPHEILTILAFFSFALGSVLWWARSQFHSLSYVQGTRSFDLQEALTRTQFTGNPRYHLASPAPQAVRLYQANTPEQNTAYFQSREHQIWCQMAGIHTN